MAGGTSEGVLEGTRWFKGGKSKFSFLISHFLSFLNRFLESEVSRAWVAVVVELLLDVDHVTAGVLQLSELGSATEVSEVAELGQP